MTIFVVSRILPESIQYGKDSSFSGTNNEVILLDDAGKIKDGFDDFNHPRIRRAFILTALQKKLKKFQLNKQDQKQQTKEKLGNDSQELDDNDCCCEIVFEVPTGPASDLTAYEISQSRQLIEFLSNAWSMWENLGRQGRQDPASFSKGTMETTATTTTTGTTHSPPLIPINFPLQRIRRERQQEQHKQPQPMEHHKMLQRPSANVMGQIGYYCTDTCTPIFGDLYEELRWDAAIVQRAVELSEIYDDKGSIGLLCPVYALTTHPGHHASQESFGGYCYVNHAALAVRTYSRNNNNKKRIAVLDIDYHCGNGTCEIFDDDPNVLVVSIHCHPDYDYPFHTGFADDTGAELAMGTTLHLPLLPGAKWDPTYKMALQEGLQRIKDFQAEALVVSMGLDTHEGDPCACRNTGFLLHGNDYIEMGKNIGMCCAQLQRQHFPVVFIQEGGYRMDKVGEAAANVLTGFSLATQTKLR